LNFASDLPNLRWFAIAETAKRFLDLLLVDKGDDWWRAYSASGKSNKLEDFFLTEETSKLRLVSAQRIGASDRSRWCDLQFKAKSKISRRTPIRDELARAGRVSKFNADNPWPN